MRLGSASPSAASGFRRTLFALTRVARAEFRSALRDRQVLLYTLVLPLALYPALFWVLLQGKTLLAGRDEARAVRIAVVAPDSVVERLQRDLGEATPATDTVGPAPEAKTPTGARARPLLGTLRFEGIESTPPDRRAFLAREDAPALLWILDADRSELDTLGTGGAASLGLARLRQRLEPLRQRLRLSAFEGVGGSAAELHPFDLEVKSLADRDSLSRYLFSLLLPLTFVVMAVFGAFYPAVDATAGERERGTLDSTLLLPIPETTLLLGKLAAVAAAATLASFLNLFGLALAAQPILAALDPSNTIQVPWGRLFLVFPLCGAFLVTVSALLFAIASSTRTFKQGQSLLGIVQLVFLLPAILAVLPGVELTLPLALVPIVQTVLSFRTLLAGDLATAAPLLAVAFVSQLAYAWIALRLALRFSRPDKGGALRALRSSWGRRTPSSPRSP